MVTNAGRGAVLDLPAPGNGVETASDSTGVATEGITYSTAAAIEAITHSTRDRYRPKAGVST
jgi:hypothetical protein